MKPDLDLLAIAVENLTDAHQATVRRVEHLETWVAGMVPVVMRTPDPNAKPRPLTPAQMVAEGSRLAGYTAAQIADARRQRDDDYRRDAMLRALDNLRRWADILANIGWELSPCEVPPLDPAEHLRQAHDAAVRAQIGWETTLPGPLDTIADDIAVAIGHIKAWLIATAPQQPAQESQEPAPEPKLAPEAMPNPDLYLTRAQHSEGDEQREAVRIALSHLRQLELASGRAPTETKVGPCFDPRRHILEARTCWSSDVDLAIAHLTAWQAIVEPEADAPTEPADPPDDDDELTALLTLAREQVMEARDSCERPAHRSECALALDRCDREHVRRALNLLRKWQGIAGVAGHKLRRDPHWAWNHLSQAADDIRDEQAGHCVRGTGVSAAIAELERWVERVERNVKPADDDDDVISAEILDADEAPEMPDLPPDSRAWSAIIYHLGLAIMGCDPGPRHWAALARAELQSLQELAVPMHWDSREALLGVAAAHVLAGSREPAIACLDKWLSESEVQA